MRSPTLNDLLTRVHALAEPAAAGWLVEALVTARANPAALTGLYPAVEERLGAAPLHPDEDEPDAWTVGDAGRVLLLRAAGEESLAFIPTLFRRGGPAERRSILRALAYLERPAETGEPVAPAGVRHLSTTA